MWVVGSCAVKRKAILTSSSDPRWSEAKGSEGVGAREGVSEGVGVSEGGSGMIDPSDKVNEPRQEGEGGSEGVRVSQ